MTRRRFVLIPRIQRAPYGLGYYIRWGRRLVLWSRVT